MKQPTLIILKTLDDHIYMVEGEDTDQFLNEESGEYDAIPATFWAYIFVKDTGRFAEFAHHMLGYDVDKTWAI